MNYTITAGESDINVGVNTAAGVRYFTINIPSKENETVTVTYVSSLDGRTSTTSSSVSVPYGTTYTVKVTANEGYIAGTANPSSGTVVSDANINVTDATVANATVTIIQSANQLIHVYTPRKSGGTDHTSTFVCPIGTTYEVEVIANNDYKAGTPNTNGGTISRDETINANPATLIIPTGSVETEYVNDVIDFTVPVGIRVLKLYYENGSIRYIGVTPGTIHKLEVTRRHWWTTHQSRWRTVFTCQTHSKTWYASTPGGVHSVEKAHFTISWSPEINKQTPTIKDY